jgi:catechol 2,3-dioxygenase-like lactoylglutathione lyase family enzyme
VTAPEHRYWDRIEQPNGHPNPAKRMAWQRHNGHDALMVEPSCKGIHHVALVVNDPEAALEFYRDVLGLSVVDRPDGARIPGSWLQLGNGQIHLFQPADPAMNPAHFAIEVDDLGSTVEAIRAQGHHVYEAEEHRQGFGYQAIVLDPSGNVIELNQRD